MAFATSPITGCACGPCVARGATLAKDSTELRQGKGAQTPPPFPAPLSLAGGAGEQSSSKVLPRDEIGKTTREKQREWAQIEVS